MPYWLLCYLSNQATESFTEISHNRLYIKTAFYNSESIQLPMVHEICSTSDFKVV